MSKKREPRMQTPEEKKRRAVHLKNQGWLNRDVAKDTGIAESTVANCWKRWAQELGMEIITREAPERDFEPMPVTTRFVDPLPPIRKEAEPVRPETPGVLESVIKRMRSQEDEAAPKPAEPLDTEDSSAAEETVEAEVIEADPLGAFHVVAVEVEAPREAAEDGKETVDKADEAPPAAVKKAPARPGSKKLPKRQAAAGRKAQEPKEVPDLKRIYDLIGLINEAVVDYAIEAAVLPDQIGQNTEITEGILTMTLSIPVGGMDR